MSFELNAIFSLTIGVCAFLGCIRVRKTDRSYVPFIYLVCIGFINEIISIYITKLHFSNAINYNIYSLAEGLLILWQFRRWGFFRNRMTYFLFQILFSAWWLFESLMINSNMTLFNSFYLIAYAFVIVLMSIHTINKMLFYEDYQLLKNSKFLICTGFVIYFIYSVLVEIFWIFGLNHSSYFRVRIYEVLAYINLLTNLLYATAILWMPMKPRFILQY